MDKWANAKGLRKFAIILIIHDSRLSGVYCIFFYNSRPRVAETKIVKGKEGQGEGK